MNNKVKILTTSALLAALSLVFLLLASVLPAGSIALVALAGCVPFAAIWRTGVLSGWYVYIVTGALALLLLPDKGTALLYVVLLGHYPMVKRLLERPRKPAWRLLLKLALACVLFAVVLLTFFPLITGHLPEWLSENAALFFLVGCLVFLVYDFAITRAAQVFEKRLRR